MTATLPTKASHYSGGRAAAASLVLLAACRPDLPDVVWTGEYLQYATSTNEPICRGSFHRQDAHVGELSSLLGIDLQQRAYYAYVDPSELDDFCDGVSKSGCAFDRKAFAVQRTNLHELSHVVADFGGFLGPRPFAEGYAEMFGDGGDLQRDRLPLETVLRDFATDNTHYYTAGLFARFLVERHGLEEFIDFLRQAGDYEDSFAQFAPRYEQVFGEPIELAMNDFEDYPSCPELSNRIAVVDCNLPLEPWEGDVITLRASLECSADDVMGPMSDSRDLMLTTRAFEVTKPGTYIAGAGADPDGWGGIRLVKCGSCWDAFELTLEPGEKVYPDLEAGRYYVVFGRSVDDPGQLSLVLGKI
ncbi:hypothetical protein [Nannocystis pusilla]|uniref:Lipoprotein n=1 Tax=Nannocystis pusilla TaxID=889268 RepID=A0ABS7TXY4_9BACT|nr:hypothetical protein [Nannocystis pusilla]MBZ5713005.1 hypothetical protein [Nannocystis pusilla]